MPLVVTALPGALAARARARLTAAGLPEERIVSAASDLDDLPPHERLFLLVDRASELRAASRRLEERGLAPVSVGLRAGAAHDRELDAAGARFLVSGLERAVELLLAPRHPSSLSLVLMAFNEEASVARAVEDARCFAGLYFSGHEIIVVDDGSVDRTRQRVEPLLARGDVRLIAHQHNKGMGAAMRSGYRAATKEHLAALAADRQVRPHELVRFLPFLGPPKVGLGRYAGPHSGRARAAMSLALRLMVRHIGGLMVDHAGTYVFHRDWLGRVDERAARSDTFIYSFELLDQLRRAGAGFYSIVVDTFERDVGSSRVASPRRIASVAGELLRSRYRRSMSR